MIYDDLPVFPPIDTETFLSLRSKIENTPKEIFRRDQWNLNARKIFGALEKNRNSGLILIENFFDKVDGFGTLTDDISSYLYLDEQIKLYGRETRLRPTNPRNWKFVGFAYFLKSYFDSSYFQKAAEYYAETIRRVSNFPDGYMHGLIMARIGGSTPNRLRYELGLSLGMLGDYESGLYHLGINGSIEEFLRQGNYDPKNCFFQEVIQYYRLRLVEAPYCLDRP